MESSPMRNHSQCHVDFPSSAVNHTHWILFVLTTFLCFIAPASLHSQPTAPESAAYETGISSAHALLKEKKLKEAYHAARQAYQIDDKRFEAYAMATLVLMEKGAYDDARDFLNKALEFAPEDKKAKLLQLRDRLGTELKQTRSSAESASMTRNQSRAPGGQQLDALKWILANADRAETQPQREAFLREFLEKSRSYVDSNPAAVEMWVSRGMAAVEVNSSRASWEVGQKIIALGGDKGPSAKALLAVLERNGWLATEQPAGTLNDVYPGLWAGYVTEWGARKEFRVLKLKSNMTLSDGTPLSVADSDVQWEKKEADGNYGQQGVFKPAPDGRTAELNLKYLHDGAVERVLKGTLTNMNNTRFTVGSCCFEKATIGEPCTRSCCEKATEQKQICLKHNPSAKK